MAELTVLEEIGAHILNQIEKVNSEKDVLLIANEIFNYVANKMSDDVLKGKCKTISAKLEKEQNRENGRKPQDDKWLQRYNEFWELYRQNLSVKEIMAQMHISRSTYYRFKRIVDPQLEEYNEVDARRNAELKDAMAAIISGKPVYEVNDGQPSANEGGSK